MQTVLSTLQSSEATTAERATAEEHLNTLAKSSPDSLLNGFVELLISAQESTTRSMAAILLRRFALKPQPEIQEILWFTISDHTCQYIKAQLLKALQTEIDPSVRHKVCDAVAEFGRQEWPELLPILLQCSQDARFQESAFDIIAQVPKILLGVSDGGQVVQMFQSGLQSSSLAIQASSLKAAVAFMDIQELDGKSRSMLSDQVLPMCTKLLHVVAEQDEQVFGECLESLIELGQVHGKLFKNVLDNLLQFLVKVISTKTTMEDNTRHTAMELMLSIAESSPGMCRKAGLAQALVPCALELMADLDDEPGWYTTTDLDDIDMEANHIVGEQVVDRLARALGGKHVLPVVNQSLSVFLQSPQWQQRHTALMCISAMAEGCIKLIEAALDQVVAMILPRVADEHSRVRYAACNAIGQLCSDLQEAGAKKTLQKYYAAQVLEALCFGMEASQQPRVQAHASAAMVNFCEGVERTEIMAPFLNAVFQKLTEHVRSPIGYVQEQAITTLATVADASGQSFVPFYGLVMPVLINIIQTQQSHDQRMLRGKAIECATLIAQAVGLSVFQQHSSDLINAMIQVQALVDSKDEDDDPLIGYLLSAWARVCKVVGKEFLPLLPKVLPSLLVSAAHKPECTVIDKDDDQISEDDNWEFVQIDGQKIGIKTSLLEEKQTAVEMLVCYATQLGPAFAPYVPQVLDLCLPMLKFYFCEDVRIAAAAVIPVCLADLKDAGVPYQDYWQKALTALFEMIQSEESSVMLGEMLTALYESIDVLGDNCLYNHLDTFAQSIALQLPMVFTRLEAELSQVDDDDEFKAGDAEESALQDMSRAIHIVFKRHRVNFLPAFKQHILNIASQMLNSVASVSQFQARQWSTCCIIDMVEFCGAEQALQFKDMFWDRFIDSLAEKGSPDVRQTAAYGIGVMAVKIGDIDSVSNPAVQVWTPLLLQAFNSLEQSLQLKWAHSEEHIMDQENIVSAIGKILRFVAQPLVREGSPMINSSQLNEAIKRWIGYLTMFPVLQDEDEAVHVASYLLSIANSFDISDYARRFLSEESLTYSNVSVVSAKGQVVKIKDIREHLKNFS